VSELATVSTHVLDVAAGKPASGVRVTLGTRTLTTDAGSYRLLFEVGAYFGTTPHLFETVALDLRLSEGRHYHVPLMIAPYSCSTYRGT